MAAWTATLQGEPDDARSLLDEAEALLVDGVDDTVCAHVLVARAVEAIWDGNPAEGVPPLERAVTVARKVGDKPLEAWALTLLAACHSFTGDLDGAVTTLQASLDLTAPVGELHVRSYALAALGMLALLRDDPGTAAELEQQALAMKMDLGDRSATAFVLEVMAWVSATERRKERAATLLGAADALWRHLGLDPDVVPYLSASRRRSEEHVGIDRGGVSFQAAFARGATLSEEQVLALALERDPVEAAPVEDPLTRRELEVARLVGAGLSNREMAERLRISQRTVESHVENILRKLGFGSRTQVVAWVVERDAAPR
jgi:non-specific serine/threonine protein kinase